MLHMLQKLALYGGDMRHKVGGTVTDAFLGGTMAQNRNSVLSEAFALVRPFWHVVGVSIVLGSLSGLATAWLLATINDGLNAPEGITSTLLLRFGGLCVLAVGGGAVAGVANSYVSQKIIAALRKKLCACILRSPIATIEQHRPHRLLAVLTGDVDKVSSLAFNLSGYAVAFAVTIGSFGYLFFLSPSAFLLAAVASVLGLAFNFRSKMSLVRDYESVRAAQDDLQKQYGAITDGARELRVSRPRRSDVYGRSLSGAVDRIAALTTRAMRRYWVTEAIGSAIFFAVVGVLLAA